MSFLWMVVLLTSILRISNSFLTIPGVNHYHRFAFTQTRNFVLAHNNWFLVPFTERENMVRRSARLQRLQTSSTGEAEETQNVTPDLKKSTKKRQKHNIPKKQNPKPTAQRQSKRPKTNLQQPSIDSSTKSNENKETTTKVPIYDLGPLVKGVVVKRPSSSIRSPYVADVEMDDGKIVLAHAPALDVGGLCVSGSTVYMKERSPAGKTSHSIELVVDPTSSTLVGAHPRLGEELAKQVLLQGLLTELPHPSLKVKEQEDQNMPFLETQCTFGDSRVDFVITEKGEKKLLIEVKNVVCADYSKVNAPTKRNANHCVIISSDEEETYQRSALFPWGRVQQVWELEDGTKTKVVSTRAIKHIRNLVEISKDKNYNSTVLFVVNRADCHQIRPCHEACHIFAKELQNAHQNGVQIVAFRVSWTDDGKCYYDGIVPIDFSKMIE